MALRRGLATVNRDVAQWCGVRYGTRIEVITQKEHDMSLFKKFFQQQKLAASLKAEAWNEGREAGVKETAKKIWPALHALRQAHATLGELAKNPAFADDAPEFNEGGIGYEARRAIERFLP